MKDNSGVKEINLFDNSEKSSNSEFSISPGLYLGMHNMQLYVQENPKLKSLLEPSVTVKELTPMFPWKPYSAIGILILFIIFFMLYFIEIKLLNIYNYFSAFSERDKERIENKILIESNDDVQSTALSVLYSSNYINGIYK